MSYGWLTESSLVPKPGKSIENVSAASLAGLRSIMLQKQEESHKRKLETGLTTRKPTKKFCSRMEARCMESNVGVSERSAKDKAAQAEQAKSFEKSRKRLEEKAKLYDALITGQINPKDVTNAVGITGNTSTFKGKIDGLCLDLDAMHNKQETIIITSSDTSSNSSKLAYSDPLSHDVICSNSIHKDNEKKCKDDDDAS